MRDDDRREERRAEERHEVYGEHRLVDDLPTVEALREAEHRDAHELIAELDGPRTQALVLVAKEQRALLGAVQIIDPKAIPVTTDVQRKFDG